jgi:hypothetical protein
MEIDNDEAMSPTLFAITASMDDLFACIRVYRKFMGEYEHIPTPSQPTNNCTALSETTGSIIKNVSGDRYEKERILCGSERIYSTE